MSYPSADPYGLVAYETYLVEAGWTLTESTTDRNQHTLTSPTGIVVHVNHFSHTVTIGK